MGEKLSNKNRDLLLFRPQLDGARFCAVLAVLIFHQNFEVLVRAKYFFDLNIFIVFFFVLSSFLITRILLTAKQKAFASGYNYKQTAVAFLVRRALRIFPAYYFYLLIVILLPVIGAYLRQHAGMFFFYLGNFQIFADRIWEGTSAHLWTLSVEEQFYLIWPWLILFIPNKRLPALFAAMMAAGIIFRVVLHAIYPDQPAAVSSDILTPSCLDAFGAGGLLAYWHFGGKTHNPVLKKILWISFPIWIGVKILHNPLLVAASDRTFATILSVLIIEGASNGYKNWFGRLMETKPILYLGKISYGIYVYHLIVRFLFWKGFFAIISRLSFLHVDFTPLVRFVAIPVVNFLLYSAISVGIATLSWYFIEQPINRLKRYVGYTSSVRKETETRKPATPASSEEKALPQKVS